LILDAFDWRVHHGEHLVVLGPNGAGKSTLLSLIGADRHPSHGSVRTQRPHVRPAYHFAQQPH